ncbi:uncharacterized protein LOC123224075 isoform X2 [Mangifera indica]|uniref:uncharacterized protein LOC123224075 isoform X2 n=1 Tax=Mangifera indica TaxID=29780 RepID=UPI001CFB64A3|nr:uncharacterized protein LOC123224075 isoform X2 [Mangifera indica]
MTHHQLRQINPKTNSSFNVSVPAKPSISKAPILSGLTEKARPHWLRHAWTLALSILQKLLLNLVPVSTLTVLFPEHHATKRGLEPTVRSLLSHRGCSASYSHHPLECLS